MRPMLRFRTRPRRGYILFELVIALTIFSIAVLGLARALSDSLQIVNTMNRETAIRIGLRSFLEERRKKPIADIPGAADDLRLGCTYTTTLEPANLQNRDGRTLSNLYTLTAKAAYTVGNEAQEESVMVYVYQPQQSR